VCEGVVRELTDVGPQVLLPVGGKGGRKGKGMVSEVAGEWNEGAIAGLLGGFVSGVLGV
jgi:hypothetical protein